MLKDGALVSSGPASELDTDELVRRMVGRPISAYFPEAEEGTELGEPRLELRGAGNGYVDGIDLELRAGEIVGVAGLQGSGRTELVEALFGIVPFTRGELLVDGRPVHMTGARQAVKAGIALITEDRKAQGLALNQSVADNALLVIRVGVRAPHRRGAPRAARGALARSRSPRRASTRRCSTSPAATSRRSCWPSGSPPSPASCCSTSPRAASTWARRSPSTSSCADSPRRASPSS